MREGGWYKYMYVYFVYKWFDSYFEIMNVIKDDDGNYICFVYKNGILILVKYILKIGLCFWF